MKLIEMQQVVDLLYNEWDLGKRSSLSKGKVCAWIYLFEILEETEKLILKKNNNNVIGVCGYSKWGSSKYLFKKNFYKLLKNILIYSPLVKNKKAILKYNRDYDYLPEELKDYFDGEVSILIVDKKYRGMHYGRNLLLEIFELAKEDGMKNLQILTDESCNFLFYEKLGCKRIYEKMIPNGEMVKCGDVMYEKGFIYEKVLK